MLNASIAQMPSLNRIKKAADEAKLKISGIEKYFINDDLKDCFLYVGKNKPECYFEERIRNGISSFSSLANLNEVKQGLKKLKNDIDNNEFEQIQTHYQNDFGDLLFITMDKKSSNTL